MKVSIITMHNYPNYGSLLQAFATQEKMKEFVPDVEIIDYSGGNSTLGHSTLNSILTGYGETQRGFRPDTFKALLKLPVHLRRKSVYNRFAKQNLNLTSDRFSLKSGFGRFPIHDYFYCTGSDQVWNPFFEENMPFFLDFVPKGKKKFAYAASFGNYGEERLSSQQVDRIKKYIDQYEYISLREERGLRFLHEQLGFKDAVQLVDPVLAMPPEFWRKFISTPIIKGDYILLYKLGDESAFESYAREISKRTGLPLIRFCSQRFGQIRQGAEKTFVLPEVSQFINLIDNASFLITDSFHGTAFAMVLNTQAIVYREEYDGERISGFLRSLGQEYRHVRRCDSFDILSDPTDFDNVNRILAGERKRSDDFLRKVFVEKKNNETSD